MSRKRTRASGRKRRAGTGRGAVRGAFRDARGGLRNRASVPTVAPPPVSLRQIDEFCWEIPARGGMLVPGRIFANEALIRDIEHDQSAQQVANVAYLPGIVDASLAIGWIESYGLSLAKYSATEIIKTIFKFTFSSWYSSAFIKLPKGVVISCSNWIKVCYTPKVSCIIK